MTDIFRRALDRCGRGGIKCHCCRPRKRRDRKDRSIGRWARRLSKHDVRLRGRDNGTVL